MLFVGGCDFSTDNATAPGKCQVGQQAVLPVSVSVCECVQQPTNNHSARGNPNFHSGAAPGLDEAVSQSTGVCPFTAIIRHCRFHQATPPWSQTETATVSLFPTFSYPVSRTDYNCPCNVQIPLANSHLTWCKHDESEGMSSRGLQSRLLPGLLHSAYTRRLYPTHSLYGGIQCKWGKPDTSRYYHPITSLWTKHPSQLVLVMILVPRPWATCSAATKYRPLSTCGTHAHSLVCSSNLEGMRLAGRSLCLSTGEVRRQVPAQVMCQTPTSSYTPHKFHFSYIYI